MAVEYSARNPLHFGLRAAAPPWAIGSVSRPQRGAFRGNLICPSPNRVSSTPEKRFLYGLVRPLKVPKKPSLGSSKNAAGIPGVPLSANQKNHPSEIFGATETLQKIGEVAF